MSIDLGALADHTRRLVPDVLFATVSGAHLYGFPSEDSDVDVRGCHRSPLEALLGLDAPDETRELAGVCDGREVEVVSHEVGKYLRLLCRHNGYILEQIFSPLVLLGGPFLEQLRPLAQRCVTRGCYHHYRGFLQGRLRLLEKEPVKKAKSLLYAYRVVLTGIHLLRTGVVEANLLRLRQSFDLPFLDELIRRKQAREHGELTDLDWAWHRAELGRWEQRLDGAYESCTLPESPAREAVSRFLVDLRLGRRDLGLVN